MKKNFLFLFIVFTTFSTMAQEIKQAFYQDGAIQHQAEVIMVQKNAPSVLYWYYLPGWELISRHATMPKYCPIKAIMYLLPIFMELPIPQKIWNRLKKCRPTTKSILKNTGTKLKQL